MQSGPAHVKQDAFNTYVRPQVEYASSVWNPSTARNIKAVEKINRGGARFVKGDYSKRSSPTQMLKSMKWNTLQDRRKVNNLCQIHKVSHDKFNVNFDHILQPFASNTRSHHRAYQNNFQPRVEAYKNSFFPRIVPDWNRLPPDLADTKEPKNFRKDVTAHLKLH